MDAGPIQVMRALLLECSGDLLHGLKLNIELSELLINYDVVVVGTSGSTEGKGVETAVRTAVKKIGKPLLVIEDYSGNYNHVKYGMPDLLLLDCEHAKQVHQKQLGDRCPEIRLVKNPRYDRLRGDLEKNREVVGEQLGSDSRMVLWAGQPETDDAIDTLKNIFPVLQKKNITLAFKAHPRDKGYAQGLYETFFNDYSIFYQDVTHLSFEEAVREVEPQLLLTQYSSLAVEAGFYAIPAVHVLFKDIAQKRLLDDKGYAIPPYCSEGASWVVSSCDELEKGFEDTFFDNKCRQLLLHIFDRYFGLMKTSKKTVSIILTTKHKE